MTGLPETHTRSTLEPFSRTGVRPFPVRQLYESDR